MASPAVTYTFSNSTTADATQVVQNFTDIINGITDGSKDLSISALTCAGNVTFNGNTTIGNASGDDLTITASLASTVSIKTNNTYNIGSATLGLQYVYLGSSAAAKTTRLVSAAVAADVQLIMPDLTGTIDLFPICVTKSGDYTATTSDRFIAGSSNWTLTLYAASGNAGRRLYVKNTSTGVITIDGNASETIDGATTFVMASQYQVVQIICDGSNWHIISERAMGNTVATNVTLTNYTTTANQYGDQLNITLSAGTWAIGALSFWYSNGVVTTTYTQMGVSTTSGNSSTGLVLGNNFMSATKTVTADGRDCLNISDYIVSPTSSTVYYMKVYAETSITNLQIAATLIAVRIR